MTTYVQFHDPDRSIWIAHLEERVEALEQFGREAMTALVREGHGDETENCPLCALVRRLRALEIV